MTRVTAPYIATLLEGSPATPPPPPRHRPETGLHVAEIGDVEKRIADLERQLAELCRVLGVFPSGIEDS